MADIRSVQCDGNNPCGRCAGQNVECRYEVPVRQSKNNMRSEIEQLRLSQRQSEQIMAALISPDTSSNVLDQLRNGETMDAIIYKLEHAEASTSNNTTNTIFRRPSDQQAIGGALRLAKSIEASPLSHVAYSEHNQGSSSQDWGSRGQSSDTDVPHTQMKWDPEPTSHHGKEFPLIGQRDALSGSGSPMNASDTPRRHGQDVLLGTKDPVAESLDFASKWTGVTNNGRFVEHIMALYFCWEYPTFASLNKEHFLEDFRNGIPRYCSALLVNAIVALGCRFSNHPESRMDPNGQYIANSLENLSL